ncbi:MAG: hypothetical protein Q7K57_16790 [Burkholderiaceae bacterium]|nr:hypothetical protein [Burkholderiaceae bacterium]
MKFQLFLDFSSNAHGERRRKKPNSGTTARAAQASRAIAQEGHQDHEDR